MRSVFYVVGLCYMLGLLFTVIVGTSLAFYFVPLFGLVAMLCAVFCKNSIKKEICVGLLCVAFGVLAFSVSYNLRVEPVNILKNHTAQLTATIIEEPYCENNRYYYQIKTKAIAVEDIDNESIPDNIKLRFSSAEDFGCELYDDISLKVEFKELGNSTYYYHNVSNGYYIGANLVDGSLELLGSKTILWDSFLNDIHNSIRDKLSTVLDDKSCDLLMALMLGDKSNMDTSMQESFRKAGVSHIVVVSGLHLSIIIGFVFAVLSLFIKEKKITAGITIAVILMYVVITGFPYSVIRCAVMNIIYLSSYFVTRNRDPFNSFGFAGLFITLPNPLAIGNLGLIMSFSATFGIITLESKISKFILRKMPAVIKNKKLRLINAIVNYLINCISVSVSATLFTLPIMVFVFESFSSYFLLSNLIITAVAPVVIVAGVIMTIMLYIPFLSVVGGIIAVAENYLCLFIVRVTEAVSDLPMSTISLNSLTIKIATIAVLIVVAVCFFTQGLKIRKTAFCVVLSTSVYVMVMSLGYLFTSQAFCLKIIDTGSGVTIIENSAEGVNILCCGGDIHHLEEALSVLENKKANLLIIPDYRKYYSKFAEDYIYQVDFNNVLLYDTDKYSEVMSIFLETENVTYITDDILDFDRYSYQIITADNKNWIYIVSNGSSVLVSPKNGECSQLPVQYRECDVFLLQNGCTNTEYILCDNIVYCGKDDGKGYYYTANGDITLYKFLNGSISLWQS